MRLTRAALWTPASVSASGSVEEEAVALATGHEAALQLQRRDGGWLAPSHAVVRWSTIDTDPSDGTPVLLDEFLVHGGTVTVEADSLVLTGFSRGVCGTVRDGSPVLTWEDGEALHPREQDEPFVPVRWVLT